MFQMIMGGIVGSALGLLNGYQQKRALDRQNQLAQQQLELQQRQFELEQQERNKQNQKEVNTDSILEESTDYGPGKTILTSALRRQVTNPLNKKKQMLGGN